MKRSAFVVERPRATALRALNYSREVERIRKSGGDRTSTSLGDIVAQFGPNYGKVFTRFDCSLPYGVELLSQADMFAAEPEGRRIRLDSLPNPSHHEVRRHDMLIAGAGTLGETELFGRGLLADDRLVGKYVGPHAMVLRFCEPDSDFALFAYAFLGTAVGIRAIRATSYGTKVLGLRTSMLRTLPIPSVDQDTRSRVAECIRTAIRAREVFAQEVALAREPVLRVPGVQRAAEASAVRRGEIGICSPPFPTLSAWNFVSAGRALSSLRRSFSSSLGDIVPDTGIFRGMRFARIRCDAPHGIDLLTQRDVFLLRPVPQRVAHPGVADRWLFPEAGSLLIGGAGTLGEGEIFGRTVLVSELMSRYAVTEDMLRVQPAGEYAAVAYAFLSSHLGRRLVRSAAVGTKILRLRPDLLRRLPMPEVGSAVVERIAFHLNNAMQARDAADKAEHEAFRIVETGVIPQWLN